MRRKFSRGPVPNERQRNQDRGQAPSGAGGLRYATDMKLSTEQIQDELRGRQGWSLDGDSIRKQFTFDGFATAIAFVVRIGFDAEAADHHPDILISSYKKVTVTFTTHSAKGLTGKDFAGADGADTVAEWLKAR